MLSWGCLWAADGGGGCTAVPMYAGDAMVSRRPGKLIWLSALVAAVLAGSTAGGATSARYRAADGTWEMSYPQGWEVVGSRDGHAVAFVGPAVILGQARLRPSLVVSILAVPPGVTETAVQQIAAQAVVQAMPVAMLLGEETMTAADGRLISTRYYSARVQQAPPLYLVVGVAVRGRVYVLLGATTSALSDYRQQAAVFRMLIASFRGR